MQWIIWTCGWPLAVQAARYLDFLMGFTSTGDFKKDKINALILQGVWLIGMVKFW